jgi:WD40 repeat protein/tRNA A-37 threonylcarbamoyl transferase component Bud32
MRPPHDASPPPAPLPATGESLPAVASPTSNLSPAGTDAPGASAPPLPAPAGRYLLGEEIGHGGMGDVLRARDPHLGRDLAVKVLRGDGHTDPEALRRFVQEAQVCGQLQHPGIVPVHDLGRLPDGRPFFAMKLVKGRTLAELLRERAGPSDDLPRFLAVFEQVCQALAYAHSKGVIHRDLKPHNVMVGAFGEVQVMDWGLAKVRRPQGGTAAGAVTAASVVRTVRSAAGDETSEGQAMGTPAYMAPEQARGEVDLLDERCDIFGLGAILCHVLTGQPPFTGGSPSEVHARAMRADLGGAFARLDGCGADAELVGLAKACLAAEAAGRPRDAGVLAVAVTAYQQAVQERLRQAELGRAAEQARAEEAQATAAQERKAREAAQARARAERRTRQLAARLAALGALLVLVFLVGFAGVSWQWRRAAVSARTEQGTSYARAIALAYAEWQAGNAGRSEQVLLECDRELRGWEWHYLRRLFQARQLATLDGHAGGVLAVAFSPDGSRLASAGADGVVKVWDRGALRTALTLRGHTARVRAVAFSPDGKQLASGGDDGDVRVWDAASGEGVAGWRGHAAGVTGLAFSPDGRRLATTGVGKESPGELKLWGATTGEALAARDWPSLLAAVAFSPDGRRLATAGRDWMNAARDLRGVAVWDAATLRPIRTLEGQQRSFQWTGVAFSADGVRVAAGGLVGGYRPAGLVRVWNEATVQEFRTPSAADVFGVAFCGRDGRIVVAATGDSTVHGWFTRSGLPAFTLRGHRRAVTAVACTPDGRCLASGGLDGVVKLWDASQRDDDLTLRPANEGVTAVAFSPDGVRLASATRDKVVKVWDMATGKWALTLRSLPEVVNGLAFSPDGSQFAAAGADGTVLVWEFPTGRERPALRGHGGPVRAVAFSPDGGRLASGGDDRIVRLWDAASGRELLALKGHGGPVHAVAFSPDGSRLASGGEDGALRVWDAASGREVLVLDGHDGPVYAVAFSRDGRRLATAARDEVVRVWDAASGRLALTLHGHAGAVRGVAYGPGGRLATAGDDMAVRLWDAAGRELLALRGHTAAVRALAFSPDGRRLASAGDDRTIKVWDGAPMEGASAPTD